MCATLQLLQYFSWFWWGWITLIFVRYHRLQTSQCRNETFSSLSLQARKIPDNSGKGRQNFSYGMQEMREWWRQIRYSQRQARRAGKRNSIKRYGRSLKSSQTFFGKQDTDFQCIGQGTKSEQGYWIIAPTVKRLLENRLRGCQAWKELLLSENQTKRRFAWVHFHIKWPVEKWKRVLCFSMNLRLLSIIMLAISTWEGLKKSNGHILSHRPSNILMQMVLGDLKWSLVGWMEKSMC